MRKPSFSRVLTIAALYNFTSNLIHPVTPTLIAQRAWPSYMFGVLFAAMSLGGFASAPGWGRFVNRFGRVKGTVLSLVAYAAAQLGFCFAPSPAWAVVARLFGGVAAIGASVATMACVADVSKEAERAKLLSVYAAVCSLMNALGYFAGGLLGRLGVERVFLIQTALLLLSALCTYLILAETKGDAPIPAQARLPGAKKRWLPAATVLFLVGVALAHFGTYGYDNAFNYYLKGELGFDSSVNGVVKGATGLIGLVANLTLNVWIVKRFRPEKAVSWLLALCAVSLAAVLLSQGMAAFFAANAAFFLFNAMYLPIQQSLAVSGKNVDYGRLSGLYNAARYLGMVFGSLFAGFIYEVNPQLPFVFQAAAFALAAAIALVYARAASLRGG